MALELVDIGANLDHPSFRPDLEQVIQRAVKVGVVTMIVTGTDVKRSEESLGLARRYPGTLYSTAGVHPHNVQQCNVETMKTLRRLAEQAEVVGIGECGLDYNRDYSPRPIQDKWFEEQVQLACELKLPLFLHERDAHHRFVQILSKYRDQFDAAVVHCFTGTGKELNTYLHMDLHIGITGWICDESRGLHLRELVRRVPLNRLMLETDAPFLTPKNIQPRPKDKRNEPAYLPHVLSVVAECLGKSVEEVAAATTKSARAFFKLDSRLMR